MSDTDSSLEDLPSTTHPTPDDYPRIYLFGDSLTEWGFSGKNCGFGWRLQQYYKNRVEVVNEGYAGQTTRSLRPRFEKYILKKAEERGAPAPVFVTIFLGANDACIFGDDTYVPIAEYEEHIRHYVNSILDHPATQGTKVVLISPPPIDVTPPKELSTGMLDIPSVAESLRSVVAMGRGHRTWESKRKFAKKIVEIGHEFEAKTEQVALLDFWTIITKFACQELCPGGSADMFHELDLEDKLPGSGMPGSKEFGRKFFTDGLHLGQTAYEVLGEELLTLVLTRWPDLTKENFPTRDLN
ncbi:hypothetical protein PRK78_006438 [Emydomyces testavorans]|uniref:SGNH hydrolase-type esterase domain-containing protein n=1 Tax=Emydomyces testavorans TaxID=2070801 RepID=A0AAF0DQ79_9EURO|nr:hypothetical protein PRK78_006438 [Emydomyces testavorans]